MKRIEDDRVLFYIKHQELIDQWAAAGEAYRRAAHEFYLSLAEDLAEVAVGLGPDVGVYEADVGFSHVGLRRDAWITDDESPLLLVGFEWRRRKTGFVGGYRISGIRVDMASAAGKQVRPAIGDRVRERRSEVGYPSRTNWWPAYRVLGDPVGDYWEDLDTFRETLVEEVVETWRTFIDDLDAIPLPEPT